MYARFAAALLLPCSLSAGGPPPAWATLAPMGLSDIQGLAVEGERLYAAGDSGIFRSDDLGRTWKQVLRGSINALAVHGIRLYAGNDRSLYRSADHGANWRDITQGLATADSAYAYKFNSFGFEGHHVYVGTFGEGVFRSGEFGESWAGTGEIDIPLVLCLFGSGNRVLAGATENTYFSDDHGASWAPVEPPLRRIKAFARHAGRLYAASFDNGIYLSPDEGRNWKGADSGLDARYAYSLCEARGALYAGTESGVARLSDRDGTWAAFGTGLDEESVGALAQCGPNLYAAGMEGRIYCMGPKCPAR